MAETVIQWMQGHGLPPQLITFLVSMIPLLELRGSIIVGHGLLGMNPIMTYVVSIVGNMVPIPFILFFIRKILDWLKKTPLRAFPNWVEKHAMKRSSQIEKYGYLGLFLFVAIPLPGTGAWTGSLLAVLFGMKRGKSLLAVLCGVMTAGLIMTIVAFGLHTAITV